MAEKAKKPKPKPGATCPYAREAILASGRAPTKAEIACSADCQKFGLYYPDGRIEQALGCMRKG